MSNYRKLKTRYTSRVHLRAALKAAGIKFEECKPGVEKTLFGYMGDERAETATFIVRRSEITASSNDIGWTWDGMQFQEIVSEYDQTLFKCTDIRKSIRREYAYAATVSQMSTKGYMTQRVDLDSGEIQINVTGRI